MLKFQKETDTSQGDYITRPTQEDMYKVTLEVENNKEIEVDYRNISNPEEYVNTLVEERDLNENSKKTLIKAVKKLVSSKKLIRTETLSDCTSIDKEESAVDLSESAVESMQNQSKMIDQSPLKEPRPSLTEEEKKKFGSGSLKKLSTFQTATIKAINLSKASVSSASFDLNNKKLSSTSLKTIGKSPQKRISGFKRLSQGSLKESTGQRKGSIENVKQSKSSLIRQNSSMKESSYNEESMEKGFDKLFSYNMLYPEKNKPTKKYGKRSKSSVEVFNRLFWDAELKRKLPKENKNEPEEEEEEEEKEYFDPSKRLYEDAKFKIHRQFLAAKKQKEIDDEDFSMNCTFTPEINRNYKFSSKSFSSPKTVHLPSKTRPRKPKTNKNSLKMAENYVSVVQNYKPFITKKSNNLKIIAKNSFSSDFKPQINKNIKVKSTFSRRNYPKTKENRPKKRVNSIKTVDPSILHRIDVQLARYYNKKRMNECLAEGSFKELANLKHTSKQSENILKKMRMNVFCNLFLDLTGDQDKLDLQGIQLDLVEEKHHCLVEPILFLLEEGFVFEAEEFISALEIVFKVHF